MNYYPPPTSGYIPPPSGMQNSIYYPPTSNVPPYPRGPQGPQGPQGPYQSSLPQTNPYIIPQPYYIPPTTEYQSLQEEKKDKGKKPGMSAVGLGIVNLYGSLYRGVSNGVTKLTTKAIEYKKKNQISDFSHLDVRYFPKNQPVFPMQYFDDTFVTLFEANLSLELQMAFKNSDPEVYLKEKCPSFKMEYLDSGCKFLVGSVGTMYVYCFRGTRTPDDVTVDLTAVPKPMGMGSVHKGFYDRFNQVLSMFPVPNFVSRILVTGHSLGGAAAQCGYLILKLLYPTIPVICVTFGCPCCVSPEIMMGIEEPREVVNFVNEGDYIPTITVEQFAKKKFKAMTIQQETSTNFSIDDFLPYRKMFTAAVEELCHYHPMGVYYYLPLPLKKYIKRPLRCRNEDHFEFLYKSQFDRNVSKFAYHMVKTYSERMQKYVFDSMMIWDNMNYTIPWLDPVQYKAILEAENH